MLHGWKKEYQFKLKVLAQTIGLCGSTMVEIGTEQSNSKLFGQYCDILYLDKYPAHQTILGELLNC